jgi:hypothetical protein
MPTSDLKAGLLLEKARREPGPQDVRDVLAALALTPPATGHTLFSLHSACRELRNRDHDLFDRLWQEQLTTGQPPWLFLDDDTLTTVSEWLDTPTHLQARDYHRSHAEILARAEARTALDELALLGADPDLIGQYRQLLAEAADQDIEQAYQPLITAEALSAWLGAGIPDKRQLLSYNREMLLSSQAADQLDEWSAEDPDNTGIRFGVVMLSLARDGLDSRVFAALDDPGQLDAFLSDLLAADQPRQLRDAAELFLCLDLDDRALAAAHLHLAIALVLTGHAGDAPGHARTAARLDPGSANRWVGDLAQLVTAHPALAAVIQALLTARPDEPDDTGSGRQADPGS